MVFAEQVNKLLCILHWLVFMLSHNKKGALFFLKKAFKYRDLLVSKATW